MGVVFMGEEKGREREVGEEGKEEGRLVRGRRGGRDRGTALGIPN
jgi:hypothetical protein